MKLRTATLIFLLVASCKAEAPLPNVDRIELSEGAWSVLHVQIDKHGVGRYLLADYPQSRAGTFAITPQQYVALLKRLEPFQRESEIAVRPLDTPCPKGVPMVTDAGILWIHWIGEDYSRHFVADYGCDYKRNRVRNEQLRSIVESLPIPNAK